jgi:hypothetical protein
MSSSTSTEHKLDSVNEDRLEMMLPSNDGSSPSETLSPTTLSWYIDHLMKNSSKKYFPISFHSNHTLNIYISFKEKQGLTLEEIFLELVRKGNIVYVRYMLNDIRLNPSCFENEAIILSVIHQKYNILELLMMDQRMDPSDQNNLALRIALTEKNHRLINKLFENKKVKESIRKIFMDT